MKTALDTFKEVLTITDYTNPENFIRETVIAMKTYAQQVALETLNNSIVDLNLGPLTEERQKRIIFKILSTPIELP